ncbi:hypothetical protein F5884DRAFT_160420 [Xylogone sp. PMI_703]|nr:hypothetical protein F5884DRAFT_160420 [Xylogone sp. PMI_703]
MTISHRDEYRQWPFLSSEEFELACAYFEQRYVSAKLGPTRNILKINSRRTATAGECYIEILRLISLSEEDDNDLSLALAKLSPSEKAVPEVDIEMIISEDVDSEALRPDLGDGGGLPPYSLHSHQPYVIYEIHIHPTYQVPTLWFTLHDLPMHEPAFDLDSVYRYLVPQEYKSRLRAAGFTGGISAAPHPITDLPAFFIHPCQTKEAMESFDCPLSQYFMIWLGIVGPCVGLWVPLEMAQLEQSV